MRYEPRPRHAEPELSDELPDSRLEMQQVDHFVALAGVLSFTRAAAICDISRQALSRSIRRLEAELGGQLVQRDRSGMHLTELGRMMLPYFESIHENRLAAKRRAQSVSRLEVGSLTIGAMCTIGPQLISGFLSQFKAQHPAIQVAVVDGSAQEIVDRLTSGEIDVALFGVPYALPPSIHQIPIFDENFVIVLPPNHQLCARSAVRGADLDQARYVSRTHCEVFEPVMHDLGSRGIFMDLVFSSPRDDWVQSMIKTGLGLGFFPEFAVSDPDLVVRPLVEPSFSRTIQLATVRGQMHPPAVGALLKEARRYPWLSARPRNGLEEE